MVAGKFLENRTPCAFYLKKIMKFRYAKASFNMENRFYNSTSHLLHFLGAIHKLRHHLHGFMF